MRGAIHTCKRVRPDTADLQSLVGTIPITLIKHLRHSNALSDKRSVALVRCLQFRLTDSNAVGDKLITIRSVLNRLSSDVLAKLQERRGLMVTKGIKNKRKSLSMSYKGDYESFLNDLTKKEMLDGFGVIERHGIEYRLNKGVQLHREKLVGVILAELNGMEPDEYVLAAPNPAEVQTTTLRSLELLSSRNPLRVDQTLSANSLRDMAVDAEQVSVASAYYDLPFLRSFLGSVLEQGSTRRHVRLVFNGLGGARLLQQQQQLTQVAKEFGVDIRLAFAPGIFHSKLYVLKNQTQFNVLVGSANATTAAFVSPSKVGDHSVNEEILVALKLDLHDADPFQTYFDRIWNRATPLDDLKSRQTAWNLIAFFRMGKLYFKPTVQLQQTFNPFVPLWNMLTPAQQTRLSASQIPYADAPGIGAFNFRLALGLTKEEAALVVERNYAEDSRQAKRVKINSYAVQSCFGYWVPYMLDETLSNNIKSAAKKRRAQLDYLDKALKRRSDGFMFKRFSDYRESIKSQLEEHGVDWKRLLKKKPYQPFDNTKQFENFLGALRARLSSDDYKERISSPFVSGAMPEIWDDYAARRDFEESFFEFLQSVSGRASGNSPAAMILGRCNIRGGATDKQIRTALEDLLEGAGWHPNDWIDKRGAH